MARIYIKSPLSEAYGRVEDIVIKHYKYGDVISRVPRHGQIPPSEGQVAQRVKWSAAAEYYRKVKAMPALAACYARELRKTGYPLPVLRNRDFHRPPIIHRIDFRRYHGVPDDVIEVQASDDVCVVGVTVTLRDSAGQITESGPATAISAPGNTARSSGRRWARPSR